MNGCTNFDILESHAKNAISIMKRRVSGNRDSSLFIFEKGEKRYAIGQISKADARERLLGSAVQSYRRIWQNDNTHWKQAVEHLAVHPGASSSSMGNSERRPIEKGQ